MRSGLGIFWSFVLKAFIVAFYSQHLHGDKCIVPAYTL
jgi:hypothetical protein